MNWQGEIAPESEDLEAASAAKLRGLPVAQSWEAIERAARQLAVAASARPFVERARSVELATAARALEAVAQGAPAGGSVARERGVWASAAMAAGGNFPSAGVAIRRTFPRGRAADGATAALMCALCPVMRLHLRAQTPLAGALDALLAGASGDALATWDGIPNATWAPELWQLARCALQATVESATRRALIAPAPDARAVRFPDGFVARLSAQIPTLLPPQLDALRGGLLSGANALVTLPPGTGKTLLGELFLAAALGRGAGLGVFLVPYVALGRGVAAALRAHFPAEIPVHRWLGGQGAGECRAGERPEIAVMTPERFDALLRARPEIWDWLRAVVVDEAHTLSGGARGVRVEGLIARLRARQTGAPADEAEARSSQIAPVGATIESAPEPGGARLLLLSAALDESARLREWTGAARVFASHWTPTARRLAFWRQDGVLEWHAELCNGTTRALGEAPLRWPHPIPGGDDGWARLRKLEPLAWRNVAHLAHELHQERGGAILCLCATRRATRELARALGALFPLQLENGGALARCIASIEARHRTLLPLAQWLKCGVAWHNSSLPAEVREHLEEAILDGQLHVVAATSTLAEGVDLPFAQTLVADWLKWDENGQRPMSSALFRNIAGRCGRAGRFTEGDTLVFDNPLGPSQFTAPAVRRPWQRRAFIGAALDEPRSALQRPEPLASAEADDSAGGARDGVEAALESQLLALRREQPQLTPGEAARLFYAARWESDFAARVAQIEANFERSGLVENGALSARGASIARTDWSPASALRLLGALQALPAQPFEGARGAARLNAYLWRALGALPEAGGEIERFFRARSRALVRPERLENIGELWLRGVAPEAMFASLPRAQNLPGLGAWLERDEAPIGAELAPPLWSGEFDRFLDFQRAGLETWTPWLWRAAGVLAPLAGSRATRIKWNVWARRFELGVDSAWAARVLKLGAPGTRTTCALVGRVWPFAPTPGDALALAPLREPSGLEGAQAAIEAALREAGGAYCFAGRNLLALRDWLWARAGLTK